MGELRTNSIRGTGGGRRGRKRKGKPSEMTFFKARAFSTVPTYSYIKVLAYTENVWHECEARKNDNVTQKKYNADSQPVINYLENARRAFSIRKRTAFLMFFNYFCPTILLSDEKRFSQFDENSALGTRLICLFPSLHAAGFRAL